MPALGVLVCSAWRRRYQAGNRYGAFAGFDQYDRAGCGVGQCAGEAAVGELGHRPARGPADRDRAGVDVVGVLSEDPTSGGVVADAGEYLTGGSDALREQPVEVVQDRGVCLLGVLGVDGQFFDYGGLADVDDLQGAAGVAGESRRPRRRSRRRCRWRRPRR